jgi:hypothetical protein
VLEGLGRMIRVEVGEAEDGSWRSGRRKLEDKGSEVWDVGTSEEGLRQEEN